MGRQIMHTDRWKKVVYTLGGIGTLVILILNLKSGFSIDSLLAIIKDLSPLFITVIIFYMVNGLFPSFNFESSANRAIEKIRQKYEGVFDESFLKNKKGTDEWLFFANPKIAFIPLKELRKGVLEIRISYSTLGNFGKTPKETPENEIKLVNIKNLIKRKTIATLQENGAKFRVRESITKLSAVKIEFDKEELNYEQVLEKVIDNIITLLKDN
jgi:hypothetical protein